MTIPQEYIEFVERLDGCERIDYAVQFLLGVTEAWGAVRDYFDPHDVARETLAILTAGRSGEFHGIQQRLDQGE